jgi:hypothetical protein
MGPFFGEAARVGLADPVGCARDDRNFVLKSHASSEGKLKGSRWLCVDG